MRSLKKSNLSMKQYYRMVDIFRQCLLIMAILKTLQKIETGIFNPPYGSILVKGPSIK